MDTFFASWKIKTFIVLLLSVSLKQKMHTDKATGIHVVVVPNCPRQPCYATLMNMLIDYLIFIKKRPSLITLPGKLSIHKIWDRLDLLVCLLFGDQSKIINFRKTLQTSLCRHGERNNKTIQMLPQQMGGFL